MTWLWSYPMTCHFFIAVLTKTTTQNGRLYRIRSYCASHVSNQKKGRNSFCRWDQNPWRKDILLFPLTKLRHVNIISQIKSTLKQKSTPLLISNWPMMMSPNELIVECNAWHSRLFSKSLKCLKVDPSKGSKILCYSGKNSRSPFHFVEKNIKYNKVIFL